jgi:DNA-binding FadR family transcriptional regulator
MIGILSATHRTQRIAIALCGVLVPAIILCEAIAPAHAQSSPKSSAEIVGQADEFNKQRTDLLERLKEFNKTINSTVALVKQKANAEEQARQTIVELRTIISPLLAQVADNGEIAELGERVLKNAIDRKKLLEQDPRVPEEDRPKLVAAWEQRIQRSREAKAELEKARLRFLDVMTLLQSKEFVIGEWAAIRAHDEALAAIEKLTVALNETSSDVDKFIAWLEVPAS